MNRKEKAIHMLEKRREINIQMRDNMKDYIRANDKRYTKLRDNYNDEIRTIDYIILRIR